MFRPGTFTLAVRNSKDVNPGLNHIFLFRGLSNMNSLHLDIWESCGAGSPQGRERGPGVKAGVPTGPLLSSHSVSSEAARRNCKAWVRKDRVLLEWDCP